MLEDALVWTALIVLLFIVLAVKAKRLSLGKHCGRAAVLIASPGSSHCLHLGEPR